MTFRRTVAAFYALLFVALTVIAGSVFLTTYREVTGLTAQEAENRQRLAELEDRLARQTIALERLQNDPVYVERVIRERLGYVRPDEVIFRFEH